jgi:tetratricopeptide (TPR) repeat protein
MDEAAEVLRQALEVDPDLASAHFFLAMALKTSGNYDEALEHLRTAAARYPRDRVVRNQIGRVLFLQRQYPEAIAELQKVLAVDPEDLQAHYTLMLASQGAGDAERARTHQTLYQRFKADESAQAITGPYRKLHPYDNNERQSVHEHGRPLEPSSPPPYAASQGQPRRPVGTEQGASALASSPAAATTGGAR